MTYTVGEMAKRLGVSPSALRYYDQEGLLPFVERTDSGRRVFKDEDYEWLQIIDCLKKTGMPLRDIREFVFMAMEGDATIDERLELILRRQEAVRAQMAELEETMETLAFKRWYYETARAEGTTARLRNMTSEEVPARFRAVRSRLRGE